MLTVLFASTTSVLFGVGDFLGGAASRKESAIAVTANAHFVGLLLFGAALLLFPAPLVMRDVYAGIVGGIGGGLGVTALYAALARGRMSIVAPITAAMSGSLPAVYDFATGTAVQPLQLVGLALALVATVVVSMTSSAEEPDGSRSLPLAALALSIFAGIGFSAGFIGFSFAGDGAGFWPLATARLTSFLILATATFASRRRFGVAPVVRRETYGAGLLDAAANVTMINAIRLGPLAIASVLGSLYPVVTVMLARFVLHEHLRPIQRAAIALALVAVVLSSAG
ncbi:MAG: EamA family transporter [Coriobacteriia bacterium]